jgi:hypothetical protein
VAALLRHRRPCSTILDAGRDAVSTLRLSTATNLPVKGRHDTTLQKERPASSCTGGTQVATPKRSLADGAQEVIDQTKRNAT